MFTVRITGIDDVDNEEYTYTTFKEAEECMLKYVRSPSDLNQKVEVLENSSVIRMCILGRSGFSRWGRMRLDYLRQYDVQLYEKLRLSHELGAHLLQVEKNAQKTFDEILTMLQENGFSKFGGIAIMLAEEQALARHIYR